MLGDLHQAALMSRNNEQKREEEAIDSYCDNCRGVRASGSMLSTRDRCRRSVVGKNKRANC